MLVVVIVDVLFNEVNFEEVIVNGPVSVCASIGKVQKSETKIENVIRQTKKTTKNLWFWFFINYCVFQQLS